LRKLIFKPIIRMYRYEVIVQKARQQERGSNAYQSFVNGTYEFDGWLNSFPCFYRKGIAPDGSRFEYLIYQEVRPTSLPKFEKKISQLLRPKELECRDDRKSAELQLTPPHEPLVVRSRSSSPIIAKRVVESVSSSSPEPVAADTSSKGGSPPPMSLDNDLIVETKQNCGIPRWVLCRVENHRDGTRSCNSWSEKLHPKYRAPVLIKEETGETDLIPPEIGWMAVNGGYCVEVRCQAQTTDIWDVGSEVEVFSTSQQRWKRAKIMEIVGDEFRVKSQLDSWKSSVRRGSGRIRPGKKQLVERSEWDVDTAVEVYSTSKQRWKNAVIIDTKPLRVEYTDGTGGKWMALGSDWLRKPGESESPTDLLKSEGEGLASRLITVIKDVFWNFCDSELNVMTLDDIIAWLKSCTPRNSDLVIKNLAQKVLQKYGYCPEEGLTLSAFFKYYEDACHDRPKAVRHDLINLGYKGFARKGYIKAWENGTSVEAWSKTQRLWKRATIVHVIESGGKLHIQYSDNTGRKWMARYSDRLRPKMTLEIILRTRRFSEVVRAVSESCKEIPIFVIREMVLMNFEQCNHCLYYDDTTKNCPVKNCKKTVCRTCNTDGLNFHSCS